ncbi:FecR domain-containing protein [Rhodoferax sp.]|uniref:FecR family protein n=1 Tax=Rhodoferax sp. TaxID=50421 RepID=UPI00261A3495|nr:FecR domain-containing protein [Rhodoferax sp.]MDD2926394.1 FecR domain-containing protein [Rhodoferax sp.]
MTFKSSCACAVMLLMAAMASAQTQRQGTLKAVAGEVSLSQAGGASRQAEAGAGLQESDRIVTGRNASVTLALRDGTIITAGPGTTMELTKVQFDATTQDGSVLVNLAQGALRVVTGWLAKLHPEQVNVKTPTSVVGVRGTDFLVEVP